MQRSLIYVRANYNYNYKTSNTLVFRNIHSGVTDQIKYNEIVRICIAHRRHEKFVKNFSWENLKEDIIWDK